MSKLVFVWQDNGVGPTSQRTDLLNGRDRLRRHGHRRQNLCLLDRGRVNWGLLLSWLDILSSHVGDATAIADPSLALVAL